jgi:opacity protein-like surface antigen
MFVLAVITLGYAATANAEFNYNFVQASYGQIDFDDIDVDGDNVGIGLSLAITDEFHLFGGADFSDLDFNIDATAWRAGLGYNTPISEIVDVVAQLSFQSIEIDTGFGSADDTGFGLGVGLRIAATELVEINGGIEYVDLDDSGDNTAFTGAALFNLTERFTIGLVASFDDDVTLYSVAGRVYF